MLYSEMTPLQRKLLFENPANYPLRVSFHGKVAIVMEGQVAFLRENGVDLDVDDRQVAEVLGREVADQVTFRRRPVGAIDAILIVTMGATAPVFALLRRLLGHR